MFIRPIFTQLNNNYRTFQIGKNSQPTNYQTATVSNLSPLQQDTVSFSARKKKKAEETPILDEKDVLATKKDMENRSEAVTIGLAKQIRAEAAPVARDLHKTLNKYLGSLIADENNPNRPIAKNGIKCRIKSDNSLCEKTATRHLRTKDEVKNELYDIIGARIVLRDASKAGVEEVMKKLTEAVKNNDLKVFEIENYRPENKYSYVSQKSLNALEKACNKVRSDGVKRSESSIPSGYTALHLSVYLPNGFRGEIQLMGVDVQDVKEIEDFIYKVKNNKSLEKKYKPIEEILKPLQNNKALQRAMNAHSQEQYIAARSKEPKAIKAKHSVKFLPVPNYLPPEFDYNELYKLKLKCDKQAGKS